MWVQYSDFKLSNTTTRTGGGGVHVDLSNSASARLGFSVVGNNRTTYLATMYKF